MVLSGPYRAGFIAGGRPGCSTGLLQCLQAQADDRGNPDWDLHLVDATVVRAH